MPGKGKQNQSITVPMAADAPTLQKVLKALGPDKVTILKGPNRSGSSVYLSQQAEITKIVDENRVKDAGPLRTLWVKLERVKRDAQPTIGRVEASAIEEWLHTEAKGVRKVWFRTPTRIAVVVESKHLANIKRALKNPQRKLLGTDWGDCKLSLIDSWPVEEAAHWHLVNSNSQTKKGT